MKTLKKKKIGILIISRFNSRRLKNKASIKINNKSLIEILVIRLLKTHDRTNLVLCSSKTNNNKSFYKKIAKKYNINLFFGSELNVLDRIIRCSRKFKFKHIVRITGDNPLTDVEAILPMCKAHLKKNYDYTFNNSLPYGTRPEVFSLKALTKNYNKVVDLNSTEYLTYFFKRSDLYQVKKKNFRKILKQQNLFSVSIDTKQDLKVLKIFLSTNNYNKINKKKLFSYLKKRRKIKKEIKKIALKTKKYDVRYQIDITKKSKNLTLVI